LLRFLPRFRRSSKRMRLMFRRVVGHSLCRFTRCGRLRLKRHEQWEQLLDNILTMRVLKPLSDDERDVIAQVIDALSECRAIACTGCGYCLEDCPMRIAIPDISKRTITSSCSASRSGGHPFDVQATRRKGGKADDCIACGACEAHARSFSLSLNTCNRSHS